MLATEHVYNHQAQQATAAHQAQATDLCQLTQAARLIALSEQKMQVTEHACRHQAQQAMGLDQLMLGVMSQSITTHQLATHRQQQHRRQLTFQFGSKFRHMNLENPRLMRGFFYAL